MTAGGTDISAKLQSLVQPSLLFLKELIVARLLVKQANRNWISDLLSGLCMVGCEMGQGGD